MLPIFFFHLEPPVLFFPSSFNSIIVEVSRALGSLSPPLLMNASVDNLHCVKCSKVNYGHTLSPSKGMSGSCQCYDYIDESVRPEGQSLKYTQGNSSVVVGGL